MKLTLETKDLQRLAENWAKESAYAGENTTVEVKMVSTRGGMRADVTFSEPEGVEPVSVIDAEAIQDSEDTQS